MKKYPGFFEPFPTQLRECLDKTHTTRKQLGDYCGCTPQTISNYSLGISKPDIYTLKRIASFFRVSVDYLLSSKEEQVFLPGENGDKSKRLNDPKYGVGPYVEIIGLNLNDEHFLYLERRFREACIDYGGKDLYRLCDNYLRLAKKGKQKVLDYVKDISEATLYRRSGEPVDPETIQVIKATTQKILSAREG